MLKNKLLFSCNINFNNYFEMVGILLVFSKKNIEQAGLGFGQALDYGKVIFKCSLAGLLRFITSTKL